MTARRINGSLPSVAASRRRSHKQGKSWLRAHNPYALDLQALIKPVIDQIVRVSRPDRIILFGSALTGRMTTDSDLDFLVVVPDQAHPERVIDRLNMEVRRKPAPCDFLVATRSMLKAHSTRCASIFKTALKEGEEVYAE